MPYSRAFGLAGAIALASLPTIAVAQQQPEPVHSSFSDGILVTTADVTSCPYRLVGAVNVNMRVIGWNDDPTREKIDTKLRKNAMKVGADAVVLVTLGHPHMTLTSMRAVPITGRAIRYLDKACAPKR